MAQFLQRNHGAGGVLTAVGVIVSVSHFCIPSLIYGALFGRWVADSA